MILTELVMVGPGRPQSLVGPCLATLLIKDLAQKVPYNIEEVHKLIAEFQKKYFQYAL